MDDILSELSLIHEKLPLLIPFISTLIAALAILFFGWIVARWAQKTLRNPKFGPRKLDATLRPILATSIFYIIFAMTLYAFLTKLGVPSNSLLAVFGAAGLAIGLALKDTLGNIAAGIMLIVLRPIDIGEFVDTPDFTGTIEEIGLFATTLKNIEGVYVYIPNGQVWNSRLINFGRHQKRKFIDVIGVAYDSDLNATRELVLNTLNALPDTDEDLLPAECYVMKFGDSSIEISCRVWLPGDEWLRRSSEARIALKTAFDKAGIEIPFPQRVIHTAKS